MRPFVLINMAMTADGKIATANRAVDSFGSVHDQNNLHRLRATCDAILCGAGTVNAAGITLGNGGARFERARRRGGLAPAPIRVVVSGRGRLSASADLFGSPGGPVLLMAGRRAPNSRLDALRRVAREVHLSGRDEVDLAAGLEWLARAWGVRRLVCEGGARLNSAMLAAGLVDELHLTICPRLFGGCSAPTIADGVGGDRLAEATEWELVQSRRVGGEMFATYRVRRSAGVGFR